MTHHRLLTPSAHVSLFAFAASLALTWGCSGTTTSNDPPNGGNDGNGVIHDQVGKPVDMNGDGIMDTIGDKIAVDTNGDGIPEGAGLDTDCDGIIDAVDTNGDGVADLQLTPGPALRHCGDTGPGTGGTSGGTGGAPATGGAPGTGGDATTGGTGGTTGPSMLGNATYQGAMNNVTDRYGEAGVFRNGVGYMFISNGWGCNWGSQNISWFGTSFTISSLSGSQGGGGCQYGEYSPAAYPSVFCGYYSQKQSPGSCGLPAAISSLTSVKTGWRWQANGNTAEYNAAWDIWLGNGPNDLSAYLMVWLRDPPKQQPAGAAVLTGAAINGLPGNWQIWTGSVNGKPIVNYVKPEGQDLSELEFDVLDVYNDAKSRNYNLPGTHITAVAIGYELWNGTLTNLVTDDFYVDVK